MAAFGLEVEADLPLPGFGSGRLDRLGPRLKLKRAEWSDLVPLIDQPRALRYLRNVDGAPFAILDRPGHDVLFFYGQRALFQLSSDRTMIRYAATDWSEPTWQRVLLDNVLWTASLLRGFHLIHASAVTTPAGLVAFVGSSGGGKTSLAAEYVRRGETLFCDDILALGDVDGCVLAHPGPGVMNLPRPSSSLISERIRIVAELGEECWVELQQETPESEPLAAIILLDRVSGNGCRCTRINATTLTLLPYAVGLPHLGPGARERFELFGGIAAAIPTFRLQAEPSIAPKQLAKLVDRAMSTR